MRLRKMIKLMTLARIVGFLYDKNLCHCKYSCEKFFFQISIGFQTKNTSFNKKIFILCNTSGVDFNFKKVLDNDFGVKWKLVEPKNVKSKKKISLKGRFIFNPLTVLFKVQ